jgi:hypothetical protein
MASVSLARLLGHGNFLTLTSRESASEVCKRLLDVQAEKEEMRRNSPFVQRM